MTTTTSLLPIVATTGAEPIEFTAPPGFGELIARLVIEGGADGTATVSAGDLDCPTDTSEDRQDADQVATATLMAFATVAPTPAIASPTPVSSDPMAPAIATEAAPGVTGEPQQSAIDPAQAAPTSEQPVGQTIESATPETTVPTTPKTTVPTTPKTAVPTTTAPLPPASPLRAEAAVSSNTANRLTPSGNETGKTDTPSTEPSDLIPTTEMAATVTSSSTPTDPTGATEVGPRPAAPIRPDEPTAVKTAIGAMAAEATPTSDGQGVAEPGVEIETPEANGPDTPRHERPDQIAPTEHQPNQAGSLRPVRSQEPPAGLMSRVERAIQMIENAPPPRQITIEADELDGLRLTVSLRPDGVVVTSSTADAPVIEAIHRALAARGFDLSDPRSGGQRPRPDAEQDEFPQPPPRARRDRRDDGIRL